MKDLQQHPQVLHFLPPHIWQLAAPGACGEDGAHENRGFEGDDVEKNGKADSLIVTIELRVGNDLMMR